MQMPTRTMRYAVILSLLLTVICSCSTHKNTSAARIEAIKRFTSKYTDPPPHFFWQGDWADKGEIVLHALRSGDSQSKANAFRLIGSTVVCSGWAAQWRQGIFSDLETPDGIHIEVDIVPFRDVHPDGGDWRAEVKGKLDSIDFNKRLIHITVKPADWIAIDVM